MNDFDLSGSDESQQVRKIAEVNELIRREQRLERASGEEKQLAFVAKFLETSGKIEHPCLYSTYITI